MSDIDLAVSRCKRLEQMLEKSCGASGRGLHEKVSSVESDLPDQLTRKLRKIATIRNKIVHEEDYKKIDDRKGFVRTCDEAERELRSLRGGNRLGRKLLLAGFAIVAIVVLIAFAKTWFESN